MGKSAKTKQKIRSRRQAKSNKRWKEKLKIRRSIATSISEVVRKYQMDKRASEIVVCPSNFSFLENTTECIATIEILYRHLKNRKNVFFKLRDVSNITADAIVVLMSIIQQFQSANVRLFGDEPENKEVCKTFEKSGIANHVHGPLTTRAIVTKNGVYCHNGVKVQCERSHELIGSAAETIWGEKKSCPGAYRTLVECMSNTHDHANPQSAAYHSWWLSVNHNEESKVVSFSFVDFGVGIFKSIKSKKFTEKFKDFFISLGNKHKNNAELLKLILGFEERRSRTGLRNRGNGLPSIARALRFNQIDSLKIISNDVFADLKTERFELMKKPFRGTFVYWELNANCVNKKFAQ